MDVCFLLIHIKNTMHPRGWDRSLIYLHVKVQKSGIISFNNKQTLHSLAQHVQPQYHLLRSLNTLYCLCLLR